MRFVSLLLLSGLATLSACGDKDDDGGGADSGTPGTDGTDGTDGTSGEDADGDGYTADEDCDDDDATIHPDATEVCDGVDNDCDGQVDDEDDSLDPSTASVFYGDSDGDGYGSPDVEIAACVQPSGAADNAEDCDDDDGGVNPGAAEVCDDDDTDEDCSGDADDADAGVNAATQTAYYPDADTDGYGDADDAGALYCDPPSGLVADNTDCDDDDIAIHPGATEVCDDADVDEDCSGDADDADAGVDASTQATYYPDADTDGYGDEDDAGALYCDPPSGVVTDHTDCDDSATGVNPGATEICDAGDTDEDCDGSADDADSSVDASTQSAWYTDADTDGYGDADATGTLACDGPSGTVADATDCDDGDGAIHPGATEICDAGDTDEDCDDLADDDDSSVDASGQTTVYADADTDGYGDEDDPGTGYCDPPVGAVTDNTDCNDAAHAVNPGATEICDGTDTDEDCNGVADDDDSGVSASSQTVYYDDADTDGYGDEDDPGTLYCDPPSGVVTDDSDCDDGDNAIHPGATEICDAGDTDEDCDGLADDDDSSVDASGQTTYYVDADSDGYGDEDDPGTGYCDAPSGVVTDHTDCDDVATGVNPGATEICDAGDTDEDCDGLADDDESSVDASGQTTVYADADTDGYGDEDDPGTGYCDPPVGAVTDNTDCNDAAHAVNPGASEICDGTDTDEDCNGVADDDDSGVSASSQTVYYDDADTDGYGDEDDPGTLYCDPPSGVVTDDSDCDDGDNAIHPGATEICDAGDTDEDCDGLADDDDSSVDASGQTTYYVDADSDGYGDEDDPGTGYCDAPSGVVTDDTDCDDDATGVNPGATEVRQNGIDEDCDGEDAPYILSDLVAGDLVLTEILQNPLASDDAYGEWFEVLNDSGGEVDVDGLAVWDLGSNSFTVSGSLRVEDGDYLVFGRSDDTSLNGDVAIDYAYSNMALGNGSDELYLADADATSYTVIYDSVAWDNGATFPDPNGASMTLRPGAFDATDNDDGDNWCEATTLFGDGDYGTPGDDNDECTTVFGPGASAGGGYGTYGANYMLGQPVTLTQSITLTGFGAEVYSGTLDLYAALYTNSGGAPGTRVAYSALTPVSAGDNELVVSGGAVSVAAGTYWLIINGGPSNYLFVEDSSGSVTTWYASSSHTSTPPATASSGATFSYDQMAAWLIGY